MTGGSRSGNSHAGTDPRRPTPLAARLCERQTRSGGLNGRPEKLQVGGLPVLLTYCRPAHQGVVCGWVRSRAPRAHRMVGWTGAHRPSGLPFDVVRALLHPSTLTCQQDVCYSWWCLSALSILGRLHWIDQPALKDFILDCQVGLQASVEVQHSWARLGRGAAACVCVLCSWAAKYR